MQGLGYADIIWDEERVRWKKKKSETVISS